MKTTMIFAISMLIAAFAAGQNKVMDEIEIIPPQLRYQQCHSINDYLRKNIKFPATENKYICQGTVVVEFTVHPNSEVTDFTFINQVNNTVDNAVFRALQSTNGLWNPGYADQIAVPMRKQVSVLFYVDSMENVIQLARNQGNKANELLFIKNNPRKALRHYNRGMVYLPHESNLLLGRAICKERLGDPEGAKTDMEKALAYSNAFNAPENEVVAIRVGK